MNSNLKNEFQQEMNQKLMPLFKQGLSSIYETCKRKNVKRCLLLKEFQQALEDIPLWNDHIVENEHHRFIASSNCGWFDDLIMAAFKASTKQMLIIQDRANHDVELDVEVPTTKVFIHMCYIELARRFWKEPSLFYDRYNKTNLLNHEERLHKSILEGIEATFLSYLPFEKVLTSYLRSEPKTVSVESTPVLQVDSEVVVPVPHVAVQPVPLHVPERVHELDQSQIKPPSTPEPTIGCEDDDVDDDDYDEHDDANADADAEHDDVEDTFSESFVTSHTTPYTTADDHDRDHVHDEFSTPKDEDEKEPSTTIGSVADAYQLSNLHTSHPLIPYVGQNEHVGETADNAHASSNTSPHFISPRICVEHQPEGSEEASDDDDEETYEEEEEVEHYHPQPNMNTIQIQNGYTPQPSVSGVEPENADAPATPAHEPTPTPTPTQTTLVPQVFASAPVKPVVTNAMNDEIRKSIKEVYIYEKKKKNEQKIKNYLGIKVDYDEFKQNPKKIRNYLLFEETNRKKYAL